MDSTSEVTPTQYQSQKNYVKQLLRSLTLASDTTRAALIIYSNYDIVKASLRGFKSLNKFEEAVDNTEYLGGKRSIDKALEAAAIELAQARPGSKKMVILLTAGPQDKYGTKSLNDAVRPLRLLGAKTYIVVIGNRVNNDEFHQAVQRPDDVIKVPSFDTLNKKVEDTVNHVLGIKGWFSVQL